MNEIVAAALRWHTARERRLEAGRHKRNADALGHQNFDPFSTTSALSLQVETSRRVTELKRKERATLRALAKACEKHRGYLGQAEDAGCLDVMPLLQSVSSSSSINF